jgi:predicted N-formylglutamate amidohydrolase
LFSEVTRGLSAIHRDRILSRHYFPYRSAVEAAICGYIAHGACAMHFSAHSFTPTIGGKARTTDIGLLYDPDRQQERAFCDRLRRILQRSRPDLRVHRNAPYRGVADGLTTFLRQRFPAEQYLGIELEVNQRLINYHRQWAEIRGAITLGLREALAHKEVQPATS